MKPTLLLLAALSAVAALPLSAKLITQPVAYEHAGVKLAGYLAYDDTKVALDKKAPGVLVVPEWWGLTDYANCDTCRRAVKWLRAHGPSLVGFDETAWTEVFSK